MQGYIESGLFKFTYGSKDNLVDFLHGDNFCQAHIKAAEAMEDSASPVVRSINKVTTCVYMHAYSLFANVVD